MSDDGRDLDPAGLNEPEMEAGPDSVLDEMWAASYNEISAIDPQAENWKIQTLPLARIKKLMKSEEFIFHELEREKVQQGGNLEEDRPPPIKFMISSEAPLVMSKACELLIKEITSRAWQHTERNRRRTLQKQDVQAAVGESEVFDFLIDIVPRVAGPNFRQGLPYSLPQAASMPSMPPFPNVQAPNFSGSFSHPGASDFGSLTDPSHGQFAFFNPLSIPGMESTDGSSIQQQLGAGVMTFPGQQMQQQQPQQQEGGQPQLQLQLLQHQGEEQQEQEQQQQALLPPQWTDPAV